MRTISLSAWANTFRAIANPAPNPRHSALDLPGRPFFYEPVGSDIEAVMAAVDKNPDCVWSRMCQGHELTLVPGFKGNASGYFLSELPCEDRRIQVDASAFLLN